MPTPTPDPDFDDLARAARGGVGVGSGHGGGFGPTSAPDRIAFETLAQELRPRLVFALQRECRGPAAAEDAAQTTLLKLWQKLHRWDPRRPFLPWCYTVAFRCLRDQQRRERRRPAVALSHAAPPADPRPGPHDRTQTADTADHVWALARDHLSDRAWTDLWLHYGEGLTPTDIATATRRRPGAVRVALHRAREKLAPHLTRFAEGEGLVPVSVRDHRPPRDPIASYAASDRRPPPTRLAPARAESGPNPAPPVPS